MSEVKYNKIERLKQILAPSEYAQKLKNLNWFDLKEEDRFYLKNFGIYNIKLRTDNFMIRIRIDAGKVKYLMLEKIAKISELYYLKIIITSRAQIELHGITAHNIYEVYMLLQKYDIETAQTLTDNFRAIMTDPYDGVAKDSFISCSSMVSEIQEYILNNPVWIGTLPRKFNTAFIGREEPMVNPWSNDLLFAVAQKDKKIGFNIYLGGKNSEVAKAANIFIEPQDTLKLFEAVAMSYHNFGLRGSRSKTRLFHLIEKVGMEQLREWIENAFNKPLQYAGTSLMQVSKYKKQTQLKGNGVGYVWATKYAECTVEDIYKIVHMAKEYELEIRLGADQNFHIIDFLNISDIDVAPSSFITACAGSRYCPLSLWDIKQDIALFPLEALEKYHITLGFSGCLKGCGRHMHTDIGLIGLRTNLYTKTEKALRVFVGATQIQEAKPSRMLYYSVPLRSINKLFEVILEDFECSGCKTFQIFSHKILNQYEISFLQVWYIVRQLYILDKSLFRLFFDVSADKNHADELVKYFKQLSKSVEIDDYVGLIRKLSHQLWDKKEL